MIKKLKLFFEDKTDILLISAASLIILPILVIGTGILHTGATAGFGTIVSLIFLFASMPPHWRMPVINWFASKGFWFDLGLTVTLTVLGFSVSVTMAIVSMFLGFSFSALLAGIRIAKRVLA